MVIIFWQKNCPKSFASAVASLWEGKITSSCMFIFLLILNSLRWWNPPLTNYDHVNIRKSKRSVEMIEGRELAFEHDIENPNKAAFWCSRAPWARKFGYLYIQCKTEWDLGTRLSMHTRNYGSHVTVWQSTCISVCTIGKPMWILQ